MINDIKIGSIIRMKRIAKGWSRKQLSSLIGVTDQQLQKYEKGINKVSASRLYRISKALECSIVDFFEEGEIPEIKSRGCIELMRKFELLNPKKKHAILYLMKAM